MIRFAAVRHPVTTTTTTTTTVAAISSTSTRHFVSTRRNPRDDLSITGQLNYHNEVQRPGWIDMQAMSMDVLETGGMNVDKRAYGIPFKIEEERAQDIACQHHGTAVEVRKVERLLVPFWLAATSAGGKFKAELFRQHPVNQRPEYIWDDAAQHNFTYPFDDHHIFNQVSATYSLPHSAVEKTLCGQHIPSMLISRWELLEECEDMKNAPKLLQFHLSVPSVVRMLGTRFDKGVLDRRAKKELKKFYPGGFLQANVRFVGVLFEVMRMRPVFLPMYRLECATISHTSYELPTYICGATGKVTGPVIHAPLKKKFMFAVGGAFAGLAMSAPIVGPVIGTSVALATSFMSVYMRHAKAVAEAKGSVGQQEGDTEKLRMENSERDDRGYKWKVEDEEKYEYEHREELREKARSRMRFEQRVQEEMAQDDAYAQHDRADRQHRKKPRRQRRPGVVDGDPLGYYNILGLKGKEGKATKTDIAKAFRKEAQIHHPDVVALEAKETAKDKMQKIVEAYNVLRDGKLRKEYDSGNLFRSNAGADAGDNA